MIDIANARALVETLRAPLLNANDVSDEAADTISALIAEVERLKTVPMKYRRMAFNAQLQEENALLLAERGSFEALWRSTMDVLETERAERDAAVLAEREACAKVCENFDDDGGAGEAWASRFADAIRARGASDDQG